LAVEGPVGNGGPLVAVPGGRHGTGGIAGLPAKAWGKGATGGRAKPRPAAVGGRPPGIPGAGGFVGKAGKPDPDPAGAPVGVPEGGCPTTATTQ